MLSTASLDAGAWRDDSSEAEVAGEWRLCGAQETENKAGHRGMVPRCKHVV